MPYAAQSDIVTLYSEDALFVADRDGDGVVDAPAVERALTYASSEIDSHIAVRYPIPLDLPVPDLVVQFCVDIALYRLALSADVLSDEHRRRYEDALASLKRIGEGKQVLDVAVPVGEDPSDNSPRPIVTGGPERLFSRDKMRDL